MGDRGQRLVPVSGRKDGQVRERLGLGAHRCFARGITVGTTEDSLNCSLSPCLTARARGVEEVQEVRALVTGCVAACVTSGVIRISDFRFESY